MKCSGGVSGNFILLHEKDKAESLLYHISAPLYNVFWEVMSINFVDNVSVTRFDPVDGAAVRGLDQAPCK